MKKIITCIVAAIILCIVNFTVSYAEDYPVIVSITPDDESAGVSVSSTIQVQYDQEMNTGTIKIELEYLGNEVSGSLSFTSREHHNDTAVFTPDHPLKHSMGYEVDINGGAEDIQGNLAYGRRNSVDTVFFTQGAPDDSSSPNIISTYPSNGQQGWDWGRMLIGVDKPLDPSTITPETLFLNGPGDTNYRIEYDTFINQSIDLYTNKALEPNTSYTITMTDEITDAEGHALAQDYTWTFNTGSPDLIPPEISQTQPEDGATNTYPYGKSVHIYFPESIRESTLNQNTVKAYDRTAQQYVDLFINELEWIEEDGSRAYIELTTGENQWSIGHIYQITLDGSIADLAGNTLGNDYTFQFEVAEPEESAPKLWADDFLGFRRLDGQTAIMLEVDAYINEGKVIIQDLTQPDKNWQLSKDGWGDWFYETPEGEDEGLQTGYHNTRVTVTDTSNNQSRSLNWQFYIFNDAPELESPINGTQNVSTTPTLSFSANKIDNADAYTLNLYNPDTDESVFKTGIFNSGQNNYSITIPESRRLKPQTTYLWAVRAIDNHNWHMGEGNSQTWEFVTGSSPETDITSNLPQTGQDKCYDMDGNEIECPAEGEDLYGQDANYQAGQPRSYAKLDALGNELSDNATEWSMVRDNVTGLIWEVKTDDGSIHDKDDEYEFDAAQDEFIPELNSQDFGGYSDWRMPTIKELSTLVHAGIYYPAINTDYFPDTASDNYWSCSSNALSIAYAWRLFFGYGSVGDLDKSNNCNVRAVRGNINIKSNFVDNGDETVTDTETGLMWQKSSSDDRMPWDDALSYCENSNLAGYSDWRLPSRNEIQSIVDYESYNPCIYTDYFLNTKSSGYWSSSYYASSTYDALHVDFSLGSVHGYYKSHGYYVRAVRSVEKPVCSYAIEPPNKEFLPIGGIQEVSIDASHTDCTWSVSEDLDWVSVSPTSGTGDGSVNVSVDENTDSSSRSGIVTIAGEDFEVSQPPSGDSPTITNMIYRLDFHSGGDNPGSYELVDDKLHYQAQGDGSWITGDHSLDYNQDYSIQVHFSNATFEGNGGKLQTGFSWDTGMSKIYCQKKDGIIVVSTWFEPGYPETHEITFTQDKGVLFLEKNGTDLRFFLKGHEDEDWVYSDVLTGDSLTFSVEAWAWSNSTFNVDITDIQVDGPELSQQTHQPAGVIGWGACIRTDPDGYILGHDIKVIDLDGISADGLSHYLTITYPNGIQRTTDSIYSIGENDAWFWYEESMDSLADIPVGTYKYQITDAAGNNSTIFEDQLNERQEISIVPEDSISVNPDATAPSISWEGVTEATHYYLKFYDMDWNTVHRGYTADTSYKVPPGVLDAQAEYQFVIRATDDHQWMEYDNYSQTSSITFTTTETSSSPYIDLTSWQGIKTWTSPRRGPHLSPWIEVYDAQGVPENIRSVKVIFPDGKTERPLYFVSRYNEYSGEYGTDYFGEMPDGEYTFVVEDRDGHVYETSEVFTADPLPAMDPEALEPAQDAIITEDTFQIRWEQVSGARMYYVRIHDQDGQTVYRERTEHPVSSITLPSALFEPGKRYNYRVRARDKFYEGRYQNEAAPDWQIFNRSFTVAPIPEGSHSPELNIADWGVSQAQIPELNGPGTKFMLEFWVKVVDQDGVPENIKSVTVTNPEMDNQEVLYYFNRSKSGSEGYYYAQKTYSQIGDVPEGNFTFQVLDQDDNADTLVDSLAITEVGVPDNVKPEPGSLIGLEPIFAWDPCENASHYKLRIYDAWQSTLFWSPRLSATEYQIPAEKRLDPEKIYQYRVYAYHEDPDGGDIDNMAITIHQTGMMPYFRTQDTLDSDQDGFNDGVDDFPYDPSASLDSDGDGYPDQWNTGYTQEDSTSLPKLSLDGFPQQPFLHVDANNDEQAGLEDAIYLLKEAAFRNGHEESALKEATHGLKLLTNSAGQ